MIKLVESTDSELLVPLLSAAEEGDERIRAALGRESMRGYLALNEAGQVVGAAAMHWQNAESEIVYIAVVDGQRGKGHGKAMIMGIIDEARRRETRSVIVGTANSSLDNIAFYQKCGFRMDSVRRDFFDYLPAPVFEHGIEVRDMIVLRLEITA